ncbi:hypothetical protein [Enterobacter sp. 148H3]|uniref:hypothetical protein n=1 Tax=Enterobacter sp. 148H3 TaxID=3077756 RepID=UPI0011BF4AEF|nr:hypothetical protein [Enterobacter sp. 148H3]
MKQTNTLGKVLLLAALLSSTSAWAATTINGSSTAGISTTFFEPLAVNVSGSAYPLLATTTNTVTPVASFTVNLNSLTGNAAIKLSSGSPAVDGTTQVINGLGVVSLSTNDNPNTTADITTGYIYSSTPDSQYTFVATVPAGTQLIAGNYNIDVTAGVWK